MGPPEVVTEVVMEVVMEEDPLLFVCVCLSVILSNSLLGGSHVTFP